MNSDVTALLLEDQDGVVVAIGLGANMPGLHGPPMFTVQAAAAEIARLPKTIALLTAHPRFTKPVGGVEQGDFVNSVTIVRTHLEAVELLEELWKIESSHGRNRENEVRWGPRPLDCDILLYGNNIINKPRLQVPHPRMLDRAFVLEPLREVWPMGESVARRLLNQGANNTM